MRIVLSGPPSVGKSTQGRRLAESLCVPHVSSGALIRQGAAHGNDRAVRLARMVEDGSLAPSAEIVAMVLDRLSLPDCRDGFVLDGFPRKIEEAMALLAFPAMRPDAFVVLSASPEVLMRRVGDRNRQATLLRPDDDADVFPRRIAIYEEQTAVVRTAMDDAGVEIHSIDAEGDREDVWTRLSQRFPGRDVQDVATLRMAI